MLRIRRARGVSRAKTAVLATVVGAVVFGLYIGYLAWTNGSFPVQEKPFGNYAAVTSMRFNGTELYFRVQWNTSGDFVPLYSQITSSQTDEANSPVCDVGVSSITKGQVLDLPFAITAPKQTLASVDLAIAVRASSNMTEFTIVYHVSQVNAQPGNMGPSNFACEQPPSPAL